MNIEESVIARYRFGVGYPQMRIDYDSNNNAIYIGIASYGAASSAAMWIIEKNTYDSNNRMTLSQHTLPASDGTMAIWDNRTIETYG